MTTNVGIIEITDGEYMDAISSHPLTDPSYIYYVTYNIITDASPLPSSG